MAQEDVIALLNKWRQNLLIVRDTQYTASQQLSFSNYLFGIPVVVLSAILGTSILATIEASVNTNLKLAAGIMGMLIAALAGIQTLLRFEERAEKHRKIGARCASLIREIDETLAYSEEGKDIQREVVKSIRQRYDEVALDAPPTSRRVLNKVLKINKSDDVNTGRLVK
jgi:hypothetical protein